jgi:D-hexose-6-phosphate mutarotase
MDTELYEGDTKAIISTNGAYVTNLSDGNGDVLFPKRTLRVDDGKEKVRGGSHVCLPNFGPGGTSGQDQHGYGRERVWERTSATASEATFRLDGSGAYEGLQAVLTYKVGDHEFSSHLTLKNTAQHSLRVAPAFHPYFCHKGVVSINAKAVTNLDEFKEAVFLSGTKQVIHTGSRLVTLQSEQLPLWAQWTDQLANYVCIEPTQSGFSFSEDITRADELETDAERHYTFTVAWSPAPLEN